MALEADPKQVKLIVILAAVGAAVAFWMLWRTPAVEAVGALQTTVDSLRQEVDSARQTLKEGAVEALRGRVALYERQLALMRRLVPTRHEVTTLIDEIASRAAQRGVRIGEIMPVTPEPGQPFDTYRYRFTVFGRYDALGEFLTDIASLPRILMPYELSLAPAPQTAVQAYGDATGALLRATFHVRTFVKGAGEATGAAR